MSGNLDLNHPDPVVRHRMLDILAGVKMPGVEEMLVAAILDPEPEIGRHACDVLMLRYPWLVLGSSGARSVSAPAARRYRFGGAWLRLRSGLSEFALSLDANQTICGERFRSVPGLVPELIEELQNAGRANAAARLAESADVNGERENGHKQILVALTYACNIACPYCYIKGWEKRFRGHMTVEALKTALNWCQNHGVNWLILGGGEPTVYPHFSALVHEAQQRGMQISLTSNGLFGPNVRQHIGSPTVPVFVCHVEQDVLLRDPRRAAVLRENLAAATAAGAEVRIRYTLTPRSDHREREAILAVARKLGVRFVNYGFAFQNMDRNNECFVHENGEKNSFDATLNAFMDEAQRAGVELQLSKPFPLCEISLPTLRRAVCEGGLRTSCNAFRRNFSKNLMVNPDLTTLPCNALGKPGPRITEFKDLREAGGYYEPFFRGLYEQPWKPECKRCVLHYRGLCHGTCLTEHYVARNKRAEGKAKLA